MAKYHSAKELEGKTLKNGDSVVFSKKIKLTYRILSGCFGRSDVYYITRDLERIFGCDELREFCTEKGYNLTENHGIMWNSYQGATKIVTDLFSLCVPTTDDSCKIKISSNVLGDIYSNVCGDWQNKLEREFEGFPFRALQVYTVGNTYQPGYYSIIDSRNTAVPNEILLVNSGRVNSRVVVDNVDKIFGYELDKKLVRPQEEVSIYVKSTFLKLGYRSANDYVKGLILEHVMLKSGLRMYSVGDKIGQYTIIKIDDGTAGLLGGTEIISMAKIVEGQKLAMTDFSNIDKISVKI